MLATGFNMLHCYPGRKWLSGVITQVIWMSCYGIGEIVSY